MTEHDEGFTSEMLDEQLEHPIENLSPADIRLLDALYQNYHETWERQTAVLDRAWERVRHNQRLHPAQAHQPWRMPTFTFAQRNKPLERIPSMSEPQKSKHTTLFSTLAAIILAALVIAGLVLVQQNQHTQTQTGSQQAATPSPTLTHTFGATVYTAPGWWSALSWSPDSQRIASLNSEGVQIWDATTGGHLLKVSAPNANTIAWSPQSQILAVNTGQEILFVNGQTGATVAHVTPQVATVSTASSAYLSATLPHSGDSPLGGLVWSPDGRFLATVAANPATGAEQLLILNVQSNQVTDTIPASGFDLDAFSFSPDSQYLALSLFSQTIPSPINAGLTRVLNLATNKVVFTQSGGGSLAWQPGSHNLVFEQYSPQKGGGSTVTLQYWNVLTNQKLNQYADENFSQVTWSPNGQLLAYVPASITLPGAIVILDPTSGKHVYVHTNPKASKGEVQTFAWSPNGAFIASANTTQITVWTAA